MHPRMGILYGSGAIQPFCRKKEITPIGMRVIIKPIGFNANPCSFRNPCGLHVAIVALYKSETVAMVLTCSIFPEFGLIKF